MMMNIHFFLLANVLTKTLECKSKSPLNFYKPNDVFKVQISFYALGMLR